MLQVVVELDPVDDDLSGVMRFKPVERTQDGLFPGTRRADDRGELPFAQIRSPPERVERTEVLVHIARDDDRPRPD